MVVTRMVGSVVFPARVTLVDRHQPSWRRFGRCTRLDAEPSAEDSAILQSLMNAGHADLVELMG